MVDLSFPLASAGIKGDKGGGRGARGLTLGIL